jgi:hypothetical protein
MRHFQRLFLLAVVVAACGSDPGSEEFTQSLQQTRPELSDADADCVVAELQREYSDADLARLIGGSRVAASEQQQFADRQLAALRKCDLDDLVSAEVVSAFAAANGLSTEVAGCAVRSLQERFGFWELTDLLASDDLELRFQRRQFEAIFSCGDRTEVADQLRPQLIDQGVPDSDADCVADAVAEAMEVEDLGVLYSGEMTDRFFTLYFNAREACDALPTDP